MCYCVVFGTRALKRLYVFKTTLSKLQRLPKRFSCDKCSMNTLNSDTDDTKLYDRLGYSEDLAMCLKWEDNSMSTIGRDYLLLRI